MSVKLSAIGIAGAALALGLVAACSGQATPHAAPVVTHTVTAAPAAAKHSASTAPIKKAPAPKVAAPAPTQAAALPTVETNSAIDGAQAVEPSVIDLSADGNGDVTGITWSSWTAYSAEGTGSINVNNCQPNCAQGATVNVPVSIALSDSTGGSSPYFTAMTLTDSSGNTNTYAASSNGSLNDVSDALYIADETPAASQAAPAGTDCGGGVYAGPNTSCPFAQNVAANYTGPGADYAYSSVTGLNYTMNCNTWGYGNVTCTGGDNASVQFNVGV